MELQLNNELNNNFLFEAKEVRTVLKDGEVWFVAKDVCDVLEIQNTTHALKRLDSDEVASFKLGGLAGEVNIINESGLYSLILSSRKPQAKQFKKWVTNEVLPTIRKTGSYNTQQFSTLQILEIATQEIVRLNEDNTRLVERNTDLKDVLLTYQKYGNSVLIREFVKIAFTEGKIEVREQQFRKWLKDNKYLMTNNFPYAKHMYYFEVVTEIYGGKPRNTTKISPKGINYFINKLIKLGQESN